MKRAEKVWLSHKLTFEQMHPRRGYCEKGFCNEELLHWNDKTLFEECGESIAEHEYKCIALALSIGEIEPEFFVGAENLQTYIRYFIAKGAAKVSADDPINDGSKKKIEQKSLEKTGFWGYVINSYSNDMATKLMDLDESEAPIMANIEAINMLENVLTVGILEKMNITPRIGFEDSSEGVRELAKQVVSINAFDIFAKQLENHLTNCTQMAQEFIKEIVIVCIEETRGACELLEYWKQI